MPIFRDKKLIFIHIPKTGGTSINHYLGIDVKNYNFNQELLYGIEKTDNGYGIEWDHATYKMIADRVEKICEYKIFCVVRHPYQRILSEYHHYKNMKYKKIIKEAKTFDEFVKELDRKWESDKSHFMTCRYYPQYKFIEGCENINILRFENLNEDFENFMGIKDKKLPKLNCSSKKSDFNIETLQIVNKLYKKDFEFFNYEMIKSNIEENNKPIFNFNRMIFNDIKNIEEIEEYDIDTEYNPDGEEDEEKEEKEEEDNIQACKKYFEEIGFTIIKFYENMFLYGNKNCVCNIIFCKKDNRGYVYIEIGGKIFLIAKKQIEFVNGVGIIDIMCSYCYNQKKNKDICLLLKYQVKNFFGGGISNAIYLFNEKRWITVDIYGSLILHNKYMNILCNNGDLYKMKLVNFKRGCDNDHIQIQYIKNIIIGGLESEISDVFYKYNNSDNIYQSIMKNGKKILFDFKKKKLLKLY